MPYQIQLDTPCLTGPEMRRLSAWKLPMSAVKHLPASQREAARAIPERTRNQQITMARRGVLDRFRFKHTTQRGPWVLWKPRRQHGDTELFTPLDVATLRVVGWLVHDAGPEDVCPAFSAQQAYAILRDDQVRASLAAPSSDLLVVYRSNGGREFGGTCFRQSDVLPEVDPAFGRRWLLPLAWLGLKADVLPRIQKLRQRQPDVWRHTWRSPETVAALDAEQRAGLM